MSAYKMVANMGGAAQRMQVEIFAQENNIPHPSESIGIKVAKGIVTGTAMAAGLCFAGATAYFASGMLMGLVNWEGIESKAIRVVTKAGIVGLSTAAGSAVGKCFIDTGDTFNEIIDNMADASFMAKVTKAMEAGTVKDFHVVDEEE